MDKVNDVEKGLMLPRVKRWGEETGGFGVVNGKAVTFMAYGTNSVEFTMAGMGVRVGVMGVRLGKIKRT